MKLFPWSRHAKSTRLLTPAERQEIYLAEKARLEHNRRFFTGLKRFAYVAGLLVAVAIGYQFGSRHESKPEPPLPLPIISNPAPTPSPTTVGAIEKPDPHPSRSPSPCRVVHVKGYRSHGKWIEAHDRTCPDGTERNNWSYDGNINPETGKVGRK